MPDLLIEDGQVRLVSPADIDRESGGQYPVSESTRVWTSFWTMLMAVGWQASPASFRSSPPVRVSFKHGSSSSLRTLTPNPRFYEMQMGWPTGWSGPEAQVTGYAAWLRRSRSQFSSLLTSWMPADPDGS